MSSISKTIEKLRNPEYRSGFVDSLISINVPFQIRALVKSRGWTQERLAERSGMLQPRISAIMTAGKTRPNIKTLRRIAEAFDCGLVVRFVPFSELVKWTHGFDPENFHVASFEEEIETLEQESMAADEELVCRPDKLISSEFVGETSANVVSISSHPDFRLAEAEQTPIHLKMTIRVADGGGSDIRMVR